VDYPDGIVVYRTRQNELLEDLRLEILKVNPSPGTTIILQPRLDNCILPAQYCQWLQENLERVVPHGVNVIINSEVPLQIIIKE
jgi:hypothetical protein